jgi:YaiO family outer membrane protein
MKKKNGHRQLLAFVLLVLSGPYITAGQEQIPEKAAAAIQAGDYESAIRLCLDGLKKNHSDYNLNFLLSRALAFSGRWDEAIRILNDLALAHSENIDILLFRGRVESWKKNYAAAKGDYDEVLRLSPDNGEALIGLAEVSSWQGKYDDAIALYKRVRDQRPENPEAYFRIGRVYLWEGNYARAEANFREAHRLAPGNTEYKRALQKAKPRLLEKFELRYEYQTDRFSDARSRYLDQNLALQMHISKNMGPLVLKYNQTHRFSRNDARYGMELYPRLWKGSYGYVDLVFSPKAVHYPKASYLLEVYQGVLSAAEISLGYRRMDFGSEQINQFLGSVGYYFGNYHAFWRWYYSRENSGLRVSWQANLRRYFSAENFVFLGCGRGARPEDFKTLEDVRADQSWVFLAGFNWYFWRQIKLQVYYCLEDEQALRRQTLFLSTGYRW